MFCFGLLKADV